jgi:UPF0716 family protein affecting phage T7 exclusion
VLAMLALTLGSARHLAVAIIVVFVVLAVVSATVISNVTAKIVSMLVFAGFALGVWTQRTNLSDCAERAQAKVTVGDESPTTCTFFGTEIDVPGVPDVDIPGTDDTSG